jgi:hypothetical protein
MSARPQSDYIEYEHAGAIERGTLAARPGDQACDWCDWCAVCDPFEHRRTRRRPAALHADLDQLRGCPWSAGA